MASEEKAWLMLCSHVSMVLLSLQSSGGTEGLVGGAGFLTDAHLILNLNILKPVYVLCSHNFRELLPIELLLSD